MKEYLMVGQVLKPQGIQGEIKIKPETDDPNRFSELKELYLDELGQERVRLKKARTGGGFVYLRLEGVESVEEAEALRGRLLFVARKDAQKLPEGRYFIADLIGLAVKDEKGNELGRLNRVYQAGGNDVYEVKGERPFLFPALKRVILGVDLKNGEMTLDLQALSEVAVYDEG